MRYATCLLALVLAGCAANDVPLADRSVVEAVEQNYPLGAGDRLRITVYGEDRLSGEFEVAANGAVPVPLVGPVAAAGLSVDAFSRMLTTQLGSGYLTDPKVAVQVLSYRPFFVMGEVERPGRYPTAPGTTLARALASAGGYTYRADKGEVFLKREGQPEVRVPSDWDFPLQPGDVVRVGERYF